MNSRGSVAIPVKTRILLLLVASIGAGIVIFATRNYGARISPDSVGYISSARSVVDGSGLINYKNDPLVSQPPLYPAILAGLDFALAIDPLNSANVVNAILFAIILYISGLMLFKHFASSPALAFLGTVSLLVSLPLIEVSLWAWSELLFICFVALYSYFLSSYLESKSTKSLLLFSISVAFACLTRYSGIVFIFTGLVGILLIRRKELNQAVSHLVAFFLISILPLGLWLVRGFYLTGTLFGPRVASLRTLSENIDFAISTLIFWVLPLKPTDSNLGLFVFYTLIVLLLGLIYVRRRRSFIAWVNSLNIFSSLNFLVVLSYAGFLVISATLVNYDQIGTRLLSPVIIPLTIFALFCIEILIKNLRLRFPDKKLNRVILIGMCLWLAYPMTVAVLNSSSQYRRGGGYTSSFWRNSQTIDFIRNDNLPECTIYSNGPDALYLLANIFAETLPPKNIATDAAVSSPSPPNIWPPDDKACVVWFDQIAWRTYLLSPDGLLSIASPEETFDFNDGAIYIISRQR